MWHHYRNTRADNIEAQSYFRRALAIDAQYPQAAGALTIAVLNAGFLGWAESDETNFAEAYELGECAIRLDPRYPNAHFAFGLACMWTRRSERGIASFEEAIKLNPSFAAAHVMLGQMYVYAGRREEGIELAENGIRLSWVVRPRNTSNRHPAHKARRKYGRKRRRSGYCAPGKRRRRNCWHVLPVRG